MARKGKTSFNRGSAGAHERPVKYRRYKYIVLIVCEDQKTEPKYFDNFINRFPHETLFLRSIGTGRDALGVVLQAIQVRDQFFEETRKVPEEVLVVFDKDDLDANDTRRQRLDRAFAVAEKEGMNTAFSNEVFELWLLLHLQDVNADRPIPRSEIYTSLEAAIRAHPPYADFVYQHGRPDIISLVQSLGNEQTAITRAKALYDYQHTKPHPIDRNPSTEVFKVVEQLNNLIVYFSHTT